MRVAVSHCSWWQRRCTQRAPEQVALFKAGHCFRPTDSELRVSITAYQARYSGPSTNLAWEVAGRPEQYKNRGAWKNMNSVVRRRAACKAGNIVRLRVCGLVRIASPSFSALLTKTILHFFAPRVLPRSTTFTCQVRADCE